ncbi:MinD-like ATPase involved in chromosome partitioning or flagellar assembly [Kineococcus radiotolerans]|uniref:MinD-like ATPase involved in chromosome partitioning or flagellar assembly n=1 Tax=Kineococcus radiotolerans TaxID=131568 RepID=A0A7W4TNS3_KINRA|nr:P-loop NTPase [Kineococcus radiotolerans]MBB2902140.1 MinD-like ATPase involved in chromosome partitioning or flagellar assembly [Kineococcus radiotolerans]
MTLPVAVSVPGSAEARLLAGWEPLRRELVVVRRCPDVADLLAAAGAGLVRAVVVGADLPGCDSETVEAFRRWGVALLVLLPEGAGGEAAERRWRAVGALRFAGEDRPAPDLAREVALAVEAVRAEDDGDADPLGGAAEPTPGPLGPAVPGRTVAVWGPHGSTGRTTVAVNLAAELALADQAVLLLDADTRGAAVGQVLGLLDEAPGLLAALRSAADGRLDVAALRRHAAAVAPGLAVLTGAGDPARWSEVRPAAFRRVLEVGAAGHDWTVVDLPGGTDDLPDGFDGGRGRDAVTAAALEAAEVVLVTGTADPVGLQRFLRTWQRMPDLAPDALVLPVVTRVRASAVGGSAARRTTSTLHRLGGVEAPVLLPEDEAADTALLAGRTLAEVAPRSGLRRAVRRLAEHLEAVVDLPEDTVDLPADPGFDRLLARR